MSEPTRNVVESTTNSATDRLRALLTERGVEWRRTPHYSSESQDNETVFAGDGIEWYANDHLNGRLGLRALRYEVTPAQAIDATLGRGTCHIVKTWSDSDYNEDWRYRCSECGGFIGVYERDPETGDVISADNYCPNCGAKVVK